MRVREKGIEKEIREMEIRKIGIGDRNRATLEIKKFRERDGVAEINRSRRDWCVCVCIKEETALLRAETMRVVESIRNR